MARVSGRNPYVAWIVGILCVALVAVFVVISLPMWPVVGEVVGSWWEAVAPFQGSN